MPFIFAFLFPVTETVAFYGREFQELSGGCVSVRCPDGLEKLDGVCHQQNVGRHDSGRKPTQDFSCQWKRKCGRHVTLTIKKKLPVDMIISSK